ncbi:MAG: hypothetical protein RJA09_1322 [Pseudomonadota bacterium]
MQSHYPERFEREMGCSEAEWLRSLPGAVAPHTMQLLPGQAHVAVGGGRLHLQWSVLPPRQIALIRLPRMAVCFVFEGLDLGARQAFMQRFDLCMQRGGG